MKRRPGRRLLLAMTVVGLLLAAAAWHWRILGDGEAVADVAAGDLTVALEVIETNVEKFRTISATRVALGADGSCLEDENARFQIASSDRS